MFEMEVCFFLAKLLRASCSSSKTSNKPYLYSDHDNDCDKKFHVGLCIRQEIDENVGLFIKIQKIVN